MATHPMTALRAPRARSFREQFGHPEGWLGFFVGHFMAVANRRPNDWVRSLLDLRGDEHVLEVGFGPGSAIKRLRDAHQGVRVEGIDSSRLMVSHARERNAFDPRVDLRFGSVESLPFADERFDRVFSFNSVQFWSDIDEGLREVRRVLRPSGVAAIAVQPRGSIVTVGEWGNALSAAVARADFADVTLAFADFGRLPAVCALAKRGPSAPSPGPPPSPSRGRGPSRA